MVLDIYRTGNKMESLKEKIKEIEKKEIIEALVNSNWIMSRAARKLGITERMIGYKIKKYRIIRKEVESIRNTENEEAKRLWDSRKKYKFNKGELHK